MKNALILHGTDNNSQNNWFQWLRKELEKENFSVLVPDLPGADKPNIEKYTSFLFSRTKVELNDESILIGHSSGAVATLGLLESLPADITVDTCYLIGSFKDDLGWEAFQIYL